MEQSKQFMELIDSIVVSEKSVTLRLNNETFIVISRDLDKYNGTKEVFSYSVSPLTNDYVFKLESVGKCEINYMENGKVV